MNTSKLIQAYFDRWEIEVSHKDEKHILGIGQAQLRNQRSVEAQPAHSVAAYSNLLLASIKEFEDKDWRDVAEKTSWYTKKRRLSCQDLCKLLRNELENISQEILYRMISN